MSTKVSVAIQLRETGQQSPIELWNGSVIGWTKRGPKYYEMVMSLEDFNRHAQGLFTAHRSPGFEYIPQVIVEEVPDALSPELVAAMEFNAGAALAREGKALPDDASDHARLGFDFVTSCNKAPEPAAKTPVAVSEPESTGDPAAPEHPEEASHAESKPKKGPKGKPGRKKSK